MATYAYCPMDWAVGAAVFLRHRRAGRRGRRLEDRSSEGRRREGVEHPCPGRVQILYAPPKQPGWLASTIKGYCQVTLSDREAWPWKQLCPVLVHEYGHLAGYRDPLNPGDPFHSHDPDDIMYAFIHPDGRCADYGTPYLGTPPPAGFQPDPELRISTGIARRGRARRATSAKSRARARAHRRGVRR
jgi:hypothetical protein